MNDKKDVEHVTCEPVAALPKRGSIFSERNVHKGLAVADHNNKLHNMRLQSVGKPLGHTVTQHQHERKEEDGTGKCEDIKFF